MPTHLKLIVCIAAVIASVALFWFDTRAGAEGAARWLALALGPVAVFAIWVFPEADAKAIRREATKARSPVSAKDD